MMMAVYNRVRDHVTEHVWETDYARAVGARAGGLGPGAHAVSFRFPGTKRANYYGDSKRKLIRANPIPRAPAIWRHVSNVNNAYFIQTCYMFGAFICNSYVAIPYRTQPTIHGMIRFDFED